MRYINQLEKTSIEILEPISFNRRDRVDNMNLENIACLFIDDEFIESMDGLSKGVEPAQKTSSTPLIQMDQPWDKDWKMGYTNIIYDEEEGKFKAWYNVGKNQYPPFDQEEDGLAYAISEDGINWEKPILNLVEEEGSKRNNLVFPFYRWGTGHGIIKDPIESDPAKKYKMLFMFQCNHMAHAGITQPISIAYSADGVNWEAPKSWVNPVIPQGSDTQLCAYWDTDIRRYVVYLRGRPNVRIICMSESHDFLEWTPRKTIIEPDETDPPKDREFYGMTSLKYRDYRIGFLSMFHTLNEKWVAENGIEDWMPEWTNQMDVQLTYSKDGRIWHRAGNREPILKCGQPGTFDSGTVYPSNSPVIVNDEIWLYYGGKTDLHGQNRYGENIPGGLNLAKIKKDRLVCIKTDKSGILTTTPIRISSKVSGRPFSVDPTTISINAVATKGMIRAEIIDPFDRIIPGFSADDCIPFTGNQTEHKLQWKKTSKVTGNTDSQSNDLDNKMTSQSSGNFKIRFYLENASLFALYFKDPS